MAMDVDLLGHLGDGIVDLRLAQAVTAAKGRKRLAATAFCYARDLQPPDLLDGDRLKAGDESGTDKSELHDLLL